MRYRAPGRVNLIGSHTDFQDGFVLPVALPLGVTVTAEPAAEVVSLESREFPGAIGLPSDGSAGPHAGLSGWGRYVAGVVWALAQAGRPPVGLDGNVTATVPAGAGLASSAALAVAVARALCDVAGWSIEAVALAQACRRAETEGAGVPCGIMDQLTAVEGREGEAILIDCRSLTIEPVAIPEGWSVIIADSGTRRELGSSPYAERRRDVDDGAVFLGVSLRDATEDMIAVLPEELRGPCRHVVTENGRVLEAVDALRRADEGLIGDVFARSHRSDVEDYGAGHPDVDALVERLLRHPRVFAARMTGGGFGGIVVALGHTDAVDDVIASLAPIQTWTIRPT